MSDTSSNTRTWLASVVMINDDTTLQSHRFFLQSFGLGGSKQLARSWTFSPSVWLIATETHDSSRAQLEAHATVTWRHRIDEVWFVASGATLELGTAARDSDLKLRVNIEREIPFRRPHIVSFAQWESVRRINATGDNGRFQVGIRAQLHDGLEVIAAYNRARGNDGNGPMSGGLVGAFYRFP